jgi:cytochrome c biogenesis protein CcdA
VREPLGEYGNLIQLFGGSVILLFALRVAGVDRWILRHLPGGRGGAPTAAVAHGAGKGPLAWLRGGFTALRTRGQARAAAGGLRARDSFLVGMGLSSACLSCMGGAVLYPLLVYAGITSWLSGMITLGLYSLAIAVPMVLIALGFFRIRLSLTRRVGVNRVLRFASAAMLACIALLILFGQERILTDWTFRLLGQVQQWTA